jgi:hypothetical protein
MNPRSARRFVAYYRVSTDRQGRSGFGLEAQQKAVADYLNGGAWELVGEFIEVESFKKSDRPELTRALDACRKLKARLVIAKLDRLSRNLAYRVFAPFDQILDGLYSDLNRVRCSDSLLCFWGLKSGDWIFEFSSDAPQSSCSVVQISTHVVGVFKSTIKSFCFGYSQFEIFK